MKLGMGDAKKGTEMWTEDCFNQVIAQRATQI